MLVDVEITLSEGDLNPRDVCFIVTGEFGGRSVSISLQSSAQGTGKLNISIINHYHLNCLSKFCSFGKVDNTCK